MPQIDKASLSYPAAVGGSELRPKIADGRIHRKAGGRPVLRHNVDIEPRRCDLTPAVRASPGRGLLVSIPARLRWRKRRVGEVVAEALRVGLGGVDSLAPNRLVVREAAKRGDFDQTGLAALRREKPLEVDLPARNDIALRMQPRCQQYRGGCTKPG